jgi:hypothetical protein
MLGGFGFWHRGEGVFEGNLHNKVMNDLVTATRQPILTPPSTPPKSAKEHPLWDFLFEKSRKDANRQLFMAKCPEIEDFMGKGCLFARISVNEGICRKKDAYLQFSAKVQEIQSVSRMRIRKYL